MIHTKAIHILLLLICFLSVPAAFADPIFVIDLDQSNDLADGYPYATVTIQFNGNVANVSADVNNTIFSPESSNKAVGIQTFGFNALGLTGIALPEGWSLGNGKKDGGNLSEFGFFLQKIDGSGNDRMDPLLFTVTFGKPFGETSALTEFFTTSTATDIPTNYLFAAHIAGFAPTGNDGLTSAWFGGTVPEGSEPVPEPGSLLLLGSGLVGLSLCCRRYKARTR